MDLSTSRGEKILSSNITFAHLNMEDDRAQVDLGIAAEIEERQEEAAAQRQPKKRFIGRRQATEAASRNEANASVEDSGAITGRYPLSIFLQWLC